MSLVGWSLKCELLGYLLGAAPHLLHMRTMWLVPWVTRSPFSIDSICNRGFTLE